MTITSKEIKEWYDQGYMVCSDVEGLEGYVLLQNDSDGIVIYSDLSVRGLYRERKEITSFPADTSAYLRNGVVHIQKQEPAYAHTEYMGN